MEKVIILRYGEIYLKGKNRNYFENTLLNNTYLKIKKYDARINKISGRFVVSNLGNYEKEICEELLTIFGYVSLSPAVVVNSNKDEIIGYCKSLNIKGTFKVNTTRADKTFPFKSIDFSAVVGEEMLASNPNLKVDLHTPNTIIDIDIRENGKTYVSFEKIKCLGGMPVSTSGKGILMLSGGIDSPVAGFLMAKRGLEIDAIYFHSHPYTSDEAKQKVIDLATTISKYCGHINLHIVPFTKIQEAIHFNCSSEFTITIMRRQMYKISEIVGEKFNCSCLITGENLAQVASQTVQGITCSNNALTFMPVFRPLISFDKIETIEIAKKIGTYDISNLPYQDCCTVFVPKKPIIKPKIINCIKEESKIPNLDLLVEESINNIETIEIN